MAGRIPSPGYSSSEKPFYGPVPMYVRNEAWSYSCGSIQPTFPISSLPQTDIMKVIQDSPVDGMLKFSHVSISAVLNPIKGCVGKMLDSQGQYLGSCTLISANLAITACHCIEGIDLQTLWVSFGCYLGTEPQPYHRVVGILEYDPELDFAIFALENTPGLIYRYPKLKLSSEVNSPPALLHCPLNKPLKVSVHGFSPSNYGPYLNTNHDSDYGSSGGAYIDASGTLVGIHLGSARHADFILERTALPIATINEKNPQGILAKFANGLWQQHIVVAFEQTYTQLPIVFRDFIDFETFDRKRLLPDYSYQLIDPSSTLVPSVLIDSHQAKHSPGWPGGKGATFDLGLDEIIQLADIIVRTAPWLKEANPASLTPSIDYWDIDETHLGKGLAKKLKDATKIAIHRAYVPSKNCWEIHLGPLKE